MRCYHLTPNRDGGTDVWFSDAIQIHVHKDEYMDNEDPLFKDDMTMWQWIGWAKTCTLAYTLIEEHRNK